MLLLDDEHGFTSVKEILPSTGVVKGACFFMYSMAWFTARSPGWRDNGSFNIVYPSPPGLRYADVTTLIKK